jgi:YD repeat-containing protein
MNLSTMALVTTETAPDLTQTVFTYMPYRTSYLETQRTVGNVKTVSTAYGVPPFPTQIATTYYNGSSSLQTQVQNSYDGYGNVVEKDESNFYSCSGTPCTVPATPPGGWLRKTFISYAYADTVDYPTWITAHIVNKPSQSIVTDGSGKPVSLTQYVYDEAGHQDTTFPAGISTHDDTNYGTNSTTPRGNLTTERHCLMITGTGTSAACSSWIQTSYNYDIAGQMTSKTTASGTSAAEKTTYTWGGTNYGYLTATTLPNGKIDRYAYYEQPGLLKSHTDPNGTSTSDSAHTTTYTYDTMHRVSGITHPDGGQTTKCYTDVGGSICTQASAPYSIYQSVTATPSPTISSHVALDGLGRKISETLASGAVITTNYDVMGRVASVSNPYSSSSNPTSYTTYTYDSLGRKTIQTNSDQSKEYWCYNGVISNQPSSACLAHIGGQTGTWVDSTDENGNQWQRTSDALGRLTEVVEPNGASQTPTMETDYGYDAQNNLLSVKQLGGGSGSSGAVSRSFTYDSLSRLLTATNPETSNVRYTYDTNGNVATKTDARGITTSYYYDALNRLYCKSYNDASNTPSSWYLYDLSPTNGKGRLSAEWTQFGACTSTPPASEPTSGFLSKRSILAYDPMGRITSEQQYTWANQAQASKTPYSLAYTYDLAGNLKTSTSGVGPAATPIIFTNSYNGAGQLQQLTSNWTNNSLYPSILFSPLATPSTALCPNSSTTQYAPFGGLLNAQFGSGIALNRTYDNRLRTSSECDTGSGATGANGASATVTITGAEQQPQ